MPSLLRSIRTVLWGALLALLITGVGQGIWGALVETNLRITPQIPWAVAAMAFFLYLLWQYLGGKWWPHTTSGARRTYLRARPVPARVFAWVMIVGFLSILALSGLWIILFQIVRMPANVLPDISSYPAVTLSLMLVMASLAAPLIEEAGFRGYSQVILERQFKAPTAIMISSTLFALAHLTHGFLWPKLLVYFLAGVVFGLSAYLCKSILPGIVVHIMADATFFTLVWPYDSSRPTIWEEGADVWFWVHCIQASVFTTLAILAFRRLASAAEDSQRQAMGTFT